MTEYQEESIQDNKKSKFFFILIATFVLGIAFGLYFYTHPEVSFLSALFAPNLITGKLSNALQLQSSPSINYLELSEYDSIEKDLHPNAPQQLQIQGGTIYLTLEVNDTLNQELKTDLETVDKDEAICDKYKSLYSDDELTKEFDCTQIKDELTSITTDGLAVYEKGELIDTKTIDDKASESSSGSVGEVGIGDEPIEEPIEPVEPIQNKTYVTYEFDASNLKAGDTIQIGEHSIVYTVVASSSNVFNQNTTTEPNNITHLTPVTTAPYNSLVAYYSFDSDKYGNYNAWTNGNGTGEGALTFNKAPQYILSPLKSQVAGLNNLTIMYWMKTGDSSYGTTVSRLYSGFTNAEFTILGSGAATYIDIYDSAHNGYLDKSKAIPTLYDNKWHQVIVTWNGTANANAVLMYVDGVLQTGWADATVTFTSLVAGANPTWIGQQGNGGSPYNGSLSNVRILNRSITQAEVTAYFNNETNNNYGAIDRTGFVMEYRLNDSGFFAQDSSYNPQTGILKSYGTAPVYDFTSNNLDGTYSGNASNTNGLYNYGSKFSGSGDYISVSDSALFDVSNITISVWVKANAYGVIAARQTNNPTTQFSLEGGNNYVAFYINAGGGGNRVEAFNSQIGSSGNGKWVHLVATYNGATGNQTIYVNGFPNASIIQAGPLNTIDTGLRIGNSQVAGWNPDFNGSIDEVMIFNDSLNSSQVLQIFNNQSARFYPSGQTTIKFQNITADGNNTINLSMSILENNYGTNTSARIGSWNLTNGYNNFNESLVAYYHADNSANDSSGNNNHGTFNGGSAIGNGLFNNSITLNGVNGYIITGDSASLNFTNVSSFSWFTWVNIAKASQGVDKALLSKRMNSAPFTGESLHYTSTNVFLVTLINNAGGGNYLQEQTTNTFTDTSKWYLVGFTYDGSQSSNGLNIYVDAINQATTVDSSTLSATLVNNVGFSIGSVAGTGQYFNGSIDEVMIFNKSLSANEIKDLYVKGRTANVGVNWTYGNYQNITAPNTNVSLSFTPYATNILPDFQQQSTPTTNFYTSLFGGTVTLNSYFTQGAGPTDEAPKVKLLHPVNNTVTNQPTHFFASNNTDNSQLVNATLYIWNSTGLVGTNFTLQTGTSNISNLSFTLPYDGRFFWNYLVFDNATTPLSAWNNSNYTILYDTLAPSNISFVPPTNATSTIVNRRYIEMNITCVDGITSCNTAMFYLWNSTQTLINQTNVTTPHFYRNFSVNYDGYFFYNVTANDTLGNMNTTGTETRNITVDTNPPNITIFSPGNQTYTGLTILLNTSANDQFSSINLTSWKYSLDGASNVSFTPGTTTLIGTADGGHNIIFYVKDALGWENQSEVRWFAVNTQGGGGSLCGVSASSTRINSTVVKIQASSWDSSGVITTYSLTGLCRDSFGTTISFPTFTTLATGTYEANLTVSSGGNCQIRAAGEQCTIAQTSWLSYFGNGTSSSSPTVNRTLYTGYGSKGIINRRLTTGFGT